MHLVFHSRQVPYIPRPSRHVAFLLPTGSFFWSTEFWGGIIFGKTQCRRDRWRRRGLVALVAVSGIIAALAGPATAVLMIPRVGDRLVGGAVCDINGKLHRRSPSRLFLRTCCVDWADSPEYLGTSEQLWPTVVDAASLANYDCFNFTTQLYDAVCPSAGYLPLYRQFFEWERGLHRKFELEDANLRKTMYHRPSVWAWTHCAHSATSTLQYGLQYTYLSALYDLIDTSPIAPPQPANLDLAMSNRFEIETMAPLVGATCVDNVRNATLTESFNITSASARQFDATADVWRYLESRNILSRSGTGMKVNNTTVAPPILAIPVGDSDGAMTLARLVILRRTENSPDSWHITACEIDPRWAKAQSVIAEFRPVGYTQQYDENQLGLAKPVVTTELDGEVLSRGTSWAGLDLPDDETVRRISIKLDWYDLLAPLVPAASIPATSLYGSPTNLTTLESLLSLQLLPGQLGSRPTRPPGLATKQAQLLAAYFADGLSRCGSAFYPGLSGLTPGLQPDVYSVADFDEADWRAMVRIGEPQASFHDSPAIAAAPHTRMVMRARVTGYVMAVSGWFDYLSVAVLLTHAVIAVAHTVWVLWHAQTSQAWDTVPELVALSQQSPPAEEGMLDNTCAGIRTMKSMGETARVETRESTDGTGGSQDGRELLLRFRKPGKSRDVDSVVVVGQLYGNQT